MNANVKNVSEIVENVATKIEDAAPKATKASKPKATKADTATKASKPKATKATATKPAYIIFDTQHDLDAALADIGQDMIETARSLHGTLRDKTVLCALNYVHIQSAKEGGWTYSHDKLSEYVRDAMFPKSTKEDTIVSLTSLYRNVDLALKMARLIHAKKGKFSIDQDAAGTWRVMAPWNFFSPVVVVNGKDVKNTNSDLEQVPSWVIEAHHEVHFGTGSLDKYGKLIPKPKGKTEDGKEGERGARTEGNSKPIAEASMPETLAHLDTLVAKLPDDAALKGDIKEAALAQIAKLQKLAGVDTSKPASSEVVDVVEVEIKDATFAQMLQAVRERLPATDKEWARCSNEERELMSLIAERIMLCATPVAMAV